MIAIPSPPSARPSSRRPVAGGVEPGAVVRDLDDEPVGQELVHDLDDAVAVVVAVAHGVRARLGHGELQVAERLLARAAQAGEPAQRKADESDVFGLRRNRQSDSRTSSSSAAG